WLFSLALVAVLIFALGKIFARLIEQRIADLNNLNDDTTSTLDPIPEATQPGPAPSVPGSPAVAPTAPADATAPNENVSEDNASEDSDSPDSVPNATEQSPEANPSDTDSAMTDAESPAEPTVPETTPADSDSTPITDTVESPEDMVEVAEVAPPLPPEEASPEASESNVADGTEVAHLVNDQSLVLVQNTQANSAADETDSAQAAGWRRLWPAKPKSDEENADANPETAADNRLRFVGAEQTVLAPSLYRPILAGDHGIEWTLAGPTSLTISLTQPAAADPPTVTDESGDDATSPVADALPTSKTITRLHDGRLLLASTQNDVTAVWQLGPRTIEINMPESQTVLAIEMRHLRPLGMDPRVPANRMPLYRVIAVQGTVQLKESVDDDAAEDSDVVTLEPNQQWQGRGNSEAEVSDVQRLPNWIDPPEKADLLVTSAREGLLDFVSRDDSFDDKQLEKELREAMAFRRVEVSALAAQTLLMIGRADVYFGASGILSTPRHRLYFTEHFQQLRQHMASDATAAKAIDEAIQQAEKADGETLFELLVGYNNDQLESGADAKLVEYLNSSSMSVRVLAIENLRDIVGDTLGYRPDQENMARRNSDIKKWQARLRRGDIRYSAED
ncbi:MAG: hypothetical protein ACF8AM_22580, partial [Rhodopirellula sp. JB055]|uniref:hypothetical protein n=1 Tax=Rhodopirellula sp. JB055 TaxID=3342846 RepID=UPI00370AEBAD